MEAKYEDKIDAYARLGHFFNRTRSLHLEYGILAYLDTNYYGSFYYFTPA